MVRFYRRNIFEKPAHVNTETHVQFLKRAYPELQVKDSDQYMKGQLTIWEPEIKFYWK